MESSKPRTMPAERLEYIRAHPHWHDHELLAEVDELRSELDAERRVSALLAESAQNIAYYMARIYPPPYEHKCRWCGDCVQRAKDELRAALKAYDAQYAPPQEQANG